MIRNWTLSDVSALAKYLNNKKIWDNCRDSLPYPYSENDAQQFINHVLNQEEKGNYCIEINGEAVGNISLMRGLDVERYNAELGYWIAEPYWNQGFMTKALKLAISDYFVVRMSCVFMRTFMQVILLQCGFWRRLVFVNAEYIRMLVSKTESLLTAIIMNYLKKTLCNCFDK